MRPERVVGLPLYTGSPELSLKRPFLSLFFSDETGKVISTKYFDMYEGGKKSPF